MYKIPLLPLQYKFDSVEILKQLNRTSRQLALLNGIVHTIPNEHLLISSLTLQEAHSSSAVENIVTTHDDLYKHDLGEGKMYFSPATKEVYNYREAITKGYEMIVKNKLLTINTIKAIQQELEGNSQGFVASERKHPSVWRRQRTHRTYYQHSLFGNIRTS